MVEHILSRARERDKPRKLRPTAARTLESVFDMLQGEIEERTVLDLFAGTGAFGILALKRGAKLAVFADSTRESERRINKALAQFRLEERAIVFREDVFHFLSRVSKDGRTYDIIFADPPYDLYTMKKVMEAILDAAVLESGGILVFEHSKREAPPQFEGLTLRRSRVFGDTTISIFDRT
ncbi:MAG: 16S rRNA (guanine(966)-N(2))-methyltransferase RsmD [Calditrichaeota bacterium]|nr:16S rRNA (guanine(966)-N(2))-methyltransferase RsmD [Calditrichota bacterium]